MHPSDDDLQRWRAPSEDNLVERKTVGDSKDWLKTVVAFANSAPLDRVAVLYIGVRDDGSVEGRSDLDGVQKTLRSKLAQAYPPIEYTTRALRDGDRPFLCVIVPGSKARPHFAGPAYVRVGSETVAASGQQFDRLIVERSSKAYRLLQLTGTQLRIELIRSGRAAQLSGRVIGANIETIAGCTGTAVTIQAPNGHTRAVGLDRVDLVENAVTGEVHVEIHQD
jgi:Putative DNA-binding domain